MPFYDVTIDTHFCASHALRHYKGRTEPTHGHNFRVAVSVTSERVDRAGMAIDFLDLKAIVDEEVGRFHYGDINTDVPEFAEDKLSPSAENIARVLYERITPCLPAGVLLRHVRVEEAPGCTATYREE